MGGPGSGGWCFGQSRSYLDDLLCIDVKEWKRRGLLKAGAEFYVGWPPPDGKENLLAVSVLQNAISLESDPNCLSPKARPIRHRLALARTECNFGGHRHWLLCPLCEHRVAKLYRLKASLLCRHCLKLPYRSQSEGDMDRALRRIRQLRGRLGGDMNLFMPRPCRPKGMHRLTFTLLYGKLVKLECDLWEALRKAALD